MKLKTISWNGKQITKPGIYSKMPLETYHRGDICDGPSVSSSDLRILSKLSPAHFYSRWSGNPNSVEREDKPHFVLGRAVHHLFLGEPFFTKLFCQQPAHYVDGKTGEVKDWTYRANYCKDWREKRWIEGRAILTEADLVNIKGMAESLTAHPIIKMGALNGMIERSIFWKDKETGIWIKIRPDSIPETSVDFVDLKTTTSVLWPDLQKTIAELGYHQQGALICEGAKIVFGFQAPTFTLVFIEKTAPYCVRVVSLKDNEIDRGTRQNREALRTIARCLKSGHWPGPGGDREDAEHIELPEWAQRQIDDKLQYGVS